MGIRINTAMGWHLPGGAGLYQPVGVAGTVIEYARRLGEVHTGDNTWLQNYIVMTGGAYLEEDGLGSKALGTCFRALPDDGLLVIPRPWPPAGTGTTTRSTTPSTATPSLMAPTMTRTACRVW